MKALASLLVLLLAAPAFAGGYRSSYGYSYFRYVYPQQNFFVGYPIRVAAMVEAEKRADPDYAEFQAFKAWQAQQQAPTQAAPVPAEALAQQAPTQLAASCVRCHSGKEPRGSLDLSSSIDAEALKKIRAKLLAGKMPPPAAPEAKDFSNDLAGQVLLDAIDLLKGPTE